MPTIILRSWLGRAGTILVAVALCYPVLTIWLADGLRNGMTALAVVLLVDVIVWLLWWRPQAVVAEEGVTVRNAFRTHRVAWDSLSEVRTRWGLLLEVKDENKDEAREAASEETAPEAVAGDEEEPAGARPRRVNVTACPRGGLFTAMRHERRAPVADERYLTATLEESHRHSYRTHMDCDDAGFLLDMYAAARREHVALAARLRRRAARVGGRSMVDEGPTPFTEPLRSQWDPLPLGALGAALLLLLVTLLFP